MLGRYTVIDGHHSRLRTLLKRFPEAEEIGTAGDSFFIVFAKPSDAVRFSLLAQHESRDSGREMTAIRDRIGIHVGEVFIDDEPEGQRSRDLYGLQVDTCARIMSLGDADQILLSRFAFDSARQVLKGDDIVGLESLSWINHRGLSSEGRRRTGRGLRGRRGEQSGTAAPGRFFESPSRSESRRRARAWLASGDKSDHSKYRMDSREKPRRRRLWRGLVRPAQNS